MSRCSPGCIAGTDVVPVVEAAAVIGRAGDLPLLRSVVGRDAKDVDGVVTELVRARVLERRRTHSWRFRHELLREVAAELAPPSLRCDLHARTAHALVNAAAAVEPDWRVIAGHFEQAQQHDEAVEAYQKAFMKTRRRGALRKRWLASPAHSTSSPAAPRAPPETAGKSPSGWSAVSWWAPPRAA